MFKLFKKIKRISFLRLSYNRRFLHENGDDITPQEIKNNSKIVIIGAGVSGLSAAHFLNNHGFENVIILEASERMGGRVYTTTFGGAVCELGASLINNSGSPNGVFQFAKDHGVSNLRHSTNKKHYITNKGEFYNEDLVQRCSLVLNNAIYNIKHRPKSTIHIEDAKNYLEAETSKIVKKMLRNQTTSAKKILTSLIKDIGCFLGTDLSNVSTAHLVSLNQSYSNPMGISNGLREIIDGISKNIPNNRILYGKPVGRIKWKQLQSSELTHVSTLDGFNYTADHIICAIPVGHLKLLASHIFSPSIPEQKVSALRSLGMGLPGRIFLKYQEPVFSWMGSPFKPVWSLSETVANCDWCNDILEISVVPDSQHVVEIKLGGLSCENFERNNSEVVIETITKTLKKLFPDKYVPYPEDLLRSSWSTDIRFLGGQPLLTVNSDENCIKEITSPLGKIPTLLFAGDYTIYEGFGTVEGARLSGIREAKRIIDFYQNK